MKHLETLYEFCQSHRLPITIHTGASIFPDARSRFCNPLYLEDVAIDFPKLTILMAHGGWPVWMGEAFSIMRRFRNVYLDISGIPLAGY